jgi:hypothetical protein
VEVAVQEGGPARNRHCLAVRLDGRGA